MVIKVLGMNRRTIYKWIARYREGGIEALKATPLAGRPLKLSGAKLQWIFRTVVTKNPLQLRFPFALWTREMVQELIERKYGIKLSAVSVGRLLKARTQLPEAINEGISAGPGYRQAVDRTRVSQNKTVGTPAKGGDLFRRRSRDQVGSSRGDHVGHERDDARRKNNGSPILGEYDLGHHVKGKDAIYDLCR